MNGRIAVSRPFAKTKVERSQRLIAVYTPMVVGYAIAMVKAFGYNSNGGPDVQEFLDLEMPSPMPGELLVEVRSAGVNLVDWKIRSGLLGEAKASDLPGVMGSEVSGSSARWAKTSKVSR